MRYNTTRLTRRTSTWRYKGRIHEVLTKPGQVATVKVPQASIYQDRTSGAESSVPRYQRDKAILHEELENDPNDTRSQYYLAQTYGCLGDRENAFKYYDLRSKSSGGYLEETYVANLRAGDMAKELGHPWEEVERYYQTASVLCHRAEAFVRLADHYRLKISNHDYLVRAYHYARTACSIPLDDRYSLFLEEEVYTYKRYKALGDTAFFVAKMLKSPEARALGMSAVEEAIKGAKKEEDKEWQRRNQVIYKGLEV